MDIRQLEYFLAIVDRGGFTRAAAALYVSQPSLSQAIRGLERDLGSELFHRIGRRALLTDAGRALIEPARAAVRSLETARASVAAVRELREGRLEVASMPSQAVEPMTTMMREFAAHYPGVSVALKAAFTSRDVVEMVRTGAAELGMLAVPRPLSDEDAREGAWDDGSDRGLVVHPVGEQRFVLVVPGGTGDGRAGTASRTGRRGADRDGPFAGRRSIDCAELAGQRLIVGQRGTGMRAYVDGLRQRGIAFTVAAETEHRVAVLPLVLAGVGVAVLAESWRGLAERAGARVLDIEPRTTLRIGLVSRRTGLSPAARAFVTTALGIAADCSRPTSGAEGRSRQAQPISVVDEADRESVLDGSERHLVQSDL
ncbi:LysR family transcriptional regulator [Streptomyces sp. NPDC001793]|uniref:LysR family transcriptional regulator n=1 Tax=Streptomyces sp. NPDC001793 TaxID=3154657 RepID=UPI0033168588